MVTNIVDKNTKFRIRVLAEKLFLKHVEANGLPSMGNRKDVIKDVLAIATIFDDLIFPEKP